MAARRMSGKLTSFKIVVWVGQDGLCLHVFHLGTSLPCLVELAATRGNVMWHACDNHSTHHILVRVTRKTHYLSLRYFAAAIPRDCTFTRSCSSGGLDDSYADFFWWQCIYNVHEYSRHSDEATNTTQDLRQLAFRWDSNPHLIHSRCDALYTSWAIEAAQLAEFEITN